MASKDSFLKTLKKIGYHEIDVYDNSDFNSLLALKELQPFFEVFTTLNEENVLSTEDIEEYSALSPTELAKIEICEKNGHFQKKDTEYEERKEVLFLQEHLAQIENHNKSIEKQLDLFKKQEQHLLEEKEIQENRLLSAKKRLQNYEMNVIPQVHEEFVSSLKSILAVFQDLESLIVHSDANNSKLVTSHLFKEIFDQYLHHEEKVFQSVNAYIQNTFQLQENGTLSVITDENLHRQELTKEIAYLQRMLKNSMINKVLTEGEIKKIRSIGNYFETFSASEFDCHPSYLKFQLDEALKLNEQLRKKEHDLKAYVFDAGSKYVDAVLTEIDLCASNEACSKLHFCIENMFLPLNILVHQRARLEILNFLLNEHRQELQVIKDLLQKVLNEIKEEKLKLNERKVLMQSKITDAAEKKTESYEVAILSSLYRILAASEEVEDSNISEVSVSDVVQRVNKLLEVKENCEKMSHEKIKTIDLMEKYAKSMETLLNCDDKEYMNWHELEQEFNVSLNNLNIKLATLEKNASECSQDLDQKQKILERKRNLHLARKLYTYALLNKELFKKYIDDIKVAMENSAN